MPHSPRFLVIDHNPVDRLRVRQALAPVGQIDEAADAVAAVDALKTGPYDLAVVDGLVSPRSASEILAQLHTVQPGLTGIFLSEEDEPEDHFSNSHHYVPKSVLREPKQLRTVVRTVLETNRLRRETERTCDQLALAVEAARLGTWGYNPDSEQFHGDARFAQLLGLPSAVQWSLSTVLAVFPEPEHEGIIAGLAQGLVEKQLRVGNQKWVDLRGRRERRAPAHFFGAALDVSVQKNEELLSSSLRETLMGVASHDLKNPLSAVRQASSLLSKSPNLDERERRFVAHIRSSAERMTNLIVQLLDLTRVRLGGGLPIVRQKTCLKVLTESVVDELRLAFPERTIDVQADKAAVNVDPDRFAQVASNLISNALTHSPAGTTVTVQVAADDKESTLKVHNRGVPISANSLKLIFDPFVQVGDKSLRSGLGLGLHISREIVHAHGGTLTVTSSSDDGTWFCVHLPP
jgi:signal transduction histidine kinase